MSDVAISPVAVKERLHVVDVLRGLAICGILVGNMQWFSGYGMVPPILQAEWPAYNQITNFLVHFLVEGKFYSIFSFLFGFGFALQIERAEERGDTNATLFKRRLAWLLIIGLLHAYLIWAGDILSVYAVMGFVLLLFRKKSNESLLKWALALLAVPVVTYILLYAAFVAFVPADALTGFRAEMANMWERNLLAVRQGSYWDIVSGYNLQTIIGRYAGLIIQMRLPKILAMFLLGMYAYRRGFFQNPGEHKPFIRRVLLWGLVLGVIGNAAMAWLAGNEAPFPPSVAGVVGVVGYSFGVPALALFITALVVSLWQTALWRRVLRILAPVGRTALTNYLLQSIVCVTLFYGYGLGWFGSFGPVRATLTAFIIFAFQIAASSLWLKYFAYGPMEWIWRQLTYKRKLGLRTTPAPS